MKSGKGFTPSVANGLAKAGSKAARPFHTAGFTIIELLVVLAAMAALLGMAIPSLHLFLSQTGQQDATVAYAQALRRAQTLAQSGRGDSPWGVLIATSSATLFKGATYATRDSSYDEPFAFTFPLTVSGLTEVDFSKFGGTTTGGTTTIAAYGAVSKTVGINAKGTLTY